MTELLFKLKKDGKTVGYLRIGCDGFIFLKDESKPDLGWQNYRYFDNIGCPIWDETCPFVCKDRNGKEVFEGDENIKHRTYPHDKGKIVWDSYDSDFKVFYPLTKHYANLESQYPDKCESIELMEDNQ